MRRATITARRWVPVAAGVALLAACGDDSGDREAAAAAGDGGNGEAEVEVAWPGDGSPTATFDLGEGLVAELPEGWEVEPFAQPSADNVAGGECAGPQARLNTGGGRLGLEMNPHECDRDELVPSDIGNGNHGTYVTLDDVPEPNDVEEQAVPAGSLVTFVQDYYECTNECHDFQDNVGLLELDDPPDPDQPTLVLLDAKGGLPREGLVAVAEAIRVDPASTTTTTTTAPPSTALDTTTTTEPGGDAAISLSIEVTVEDQPIRSGTLECGATAVGTGHLADPEAATGACDLLDGESARTRLVEGYQQDDAICTMIYGGPDVATVTGTVHGEPVDTSFSREDGCAIADYDDFEALIGSAAT